MLKLKLDRSKIKANNTNVPEKQLLMNLGIGITQTFLRYIVVI